YRPRAQPEADRRGRQSPAPPAPARQWPASPAEASDRLDPGARLVASEVPFQPGVQGEGRCPDTQEQAGEEEERRRVHHRIQHQPGDERNQEGSRQEDAQPNQVLSARAPDATLHVTRALSPPRGRHVATHAASSRSRMTFQPQISLAGAEFNSPSGDRPNRAQPRLVRRKRRSMMITIPNSISRMAPSKTFLCP